MTNKKLIIRKAHRYIALVVGIQLFFWSIGGLYFALFPISEIHGDQFKNTKSTISWSKIVKYKNISDVLLLPISDLKSIDDIKNIQMLNVNGDILYEVDLETSKTIWIDAITGDLRALRTPAQIRELAMSMVINAGDILDIKLLDKVALDSEFRGKPLPAYVVSFDSSEQLNAYFNAYSGELITVRSNRWRIFDFLWMLHVMDYETRDNFNHGLLQFFASLAVITSISGIVLWFVSRRKKR